MSSAEQDVYRRGLERLLPSDPAHVGEVVAIFAVGERLPDEDESEVVFRSTRPPSRTPMAGQVRE